MSIISKELLSEVLQQNVISVYEQRNQHRYTTSSINGPWTSGSDVPLPNIYELATRCKEWAWSNYKLSIISGYTISGNIVANIMVKHMSMCEHHYKADTEPEAIFKACEYILKEHPCNQLT